MIFFVAAPKLTTVILICNILFIFSFNLELKKPNLLFFCCTYASISLYFCLQMLYPLVTNF